LNLENYWINKIKSRYIGDDGAVIDNKVYAMDAFWEGTHFKKNWMTVEQIAYKAFMVNLSDMVAMNATAKYMLITVALPKNVKKKFLDRLSTKFNDLANQYNIKIIGGDTIGSNKIGVAITMIGETNNPLTREGVNNGDILAYTGVLGNAKDDLDRLLNGERIEDSAKFYNPILRIDFIKAVTPWLSAGMDISDGLYCDCNKLLKCSHKYIQELKVIPAQIGESGEEYEMLIAIPPQNLKRVQRIAKLTNTPLTLFATATDKKSEYYPCLEQHFSNKTY